MITLIDFILVLLSCVDPNMCFFVKSCYKLSGISGFDLTELQKETNF